MSRVEEPGDEIAAELLAVEERRQRALLAVDTDVLDELFDESLVHIHAPGVTHDKAQLLEHVQTRQAYIGMERGELNLRLIGDVAIMTGPLTNRLHNPDGSERTVTGVATQVLHRGDDGRWRFLSFQLTPLGQEVWGQLPSERAAEEDGDRRNSGARQENDTHRAASGEDTRQNDGQRNSGWQNDGWQNDGQRDRIPAPHPENHGEQEAS